MTLNELIDEIIKPNFTPLYIEDDQIIGFAKKAVRFYQDKAGIIVRIVTPDDETELEKPDDFLFFGSAHDAEGNYHTCTITDETITVDVTDRSIPPYEIAYFRNIADIDPASDSIPDAAFHFVRDYTEILTEIANTRRARGIAMATGRQAEFPSDEELQQRRQMIEDTLEETDFILPVVTVRG